MPPDAQDLPSGPGRIKRNTACTSCRDAKVRCNPSLQPNKPCQRCTKHQLSCVVDKTHKRISRKSKLDELAREIQSIKQSVGDRSVPPLTTPAYSTQDAVAPPKEPPASASASRLEWTPAETLAALARPATPEVTSGNNTTLEPSPLSQTTTLSHALSVNPILPRALGSHPFPGEDIDYYFHKYFKHFHPYMPIIRHKDPNKCYDACPLLFWTIVFIASRRYARDTATPSFMLDAIKKEMFLAITIFPLNMHEINALILISTWGFPDVRFMRDPTSIFSSVAMNACLLLGIHQGKGRNKEYTVGVFQNDFSDEDAAFTWSGYNIISQRMSSYLGLPSLGCLFNNTTQNVMDGGTPFPVPSDFRVLLRCQKFCNHLNKTMIAYLEESHGVSEHMVRLLEDEWTNVQRLIISDSADALDRLNVLFVSLEIQQFYMLPVPGYDPEALKCNVLRAYNTAQTIIRDTVEIDRKTDFLLHAPHFYLRSLICAACTLCKVVRSTFKNLLDRKQLEQSAVDMIAITKKSIIMEDDLASRLTNLLEPWFQLALEPEWDEYPVSTFTHRLSASPTLDCIVRWKHDHEFLINSKNQPPLPDGADGAAAATMAITDPMQFIDWGSLDDFDWSFEPNILLSGT